MFSAPNLLARVNPILEQFFPDPAGEDFVLALEATGSRRDQSTSAAQSTVSAQAHTAAQSTVAAQSTSAAQSTVAAQTTVAAQSTAAADIAAAADYDELLADPVFEIGSAIPSHGGARKKEAVNKRKGAKGAKRTVNAATDNEDKMETV